MKTKMIEYMTDEELLNVRLEDAERIHDWRNYIGSHTAPLWSSFTAEQRRALALDAHIKAMWEEWE